VRPAPDPGREVRSGDPRLVIADAYRAHAYAVRRHAARAALGDYQAAEDATQEAFIDAFRNWQKFRWLAPGEQRAWLCARARWRVIDSWRPSSREYPADTPPEQTDPQAHEDILLAGITAERFWKVITTAVPQRAARRLSQMA
jgi:DNA-directed RNA polymerase specialized sigma24 family protein